MFSDVTNFADSRSKNDDDSRTQGVCNVINIFFESSSG